MTEFETEKRPVGAWTIIYQPDLPAEIINTYQKMFDFLGSDVINAIRYNYMKMLHVACFQTTLALTDPINTLLELENFEFVVDNNKVLSFSDSGQSVLRITQRHNNDYFAIIDPACYLFDIAYEDMPIAVGNQRHIESAMTEIYSRLTGSSFSIKIISSPASKT